jgi:hypothetical protein
VGMPPWTLRVQSDAERHGIHSHAERGNDRNTLNLELIDQPPLLFGQFGQIRTRRT